MESVRTSTFNIIIDRVQITRSDTRRLLTICNYYYRYYTWRRVYIPYTNRKTIFIHNYVVYIVSIIMWQNYLRHGGASMYYRYNDIFCPRGTRLVEYTYNMVRRIRTSNIQNVRIFRTRVPAAVEFE